jgi:uncharacterized protein YvpB
MVVILAFGGARRFAPPVMTALLLALAMPSPGTSALAAAPVDNSSRMYTLDGYGGIHPVGASPAVAASGYWSGFDIARGLALFNDGSGGYTLDGWGGVHSFGSAPSIADGAHAYWQFFDIARAVVLAPWATSATPAGWTLDGWGGVHAFGGAPEVSDDTHDYWRYWDIARGLVVLPGDAPGTVRGYILDGYGGLHPFAGGGAPMPPPAQSTVYWAGWDIAKAVALVAGTAGGYVMDGYGGLHAFAMQGTALPAAFPDGSHSYWPGWNIARGLTPWTGAPAGSPGGWTVDGYGGVHAFGSAPTLAGSAYWSGWDIARAGAGAGSGSSGRLPTSRVLNIQYHRQVYPLSCEAAALQMGLGYEGIGVNQSTIMGVLGTDGRGPSRDRAGFHWGDPYASFVGNVYGSEDNLTGYGTYMSAISRTATALGGRVLVSMEGFRPSDIYYNVVQGHPAVVWISFDYAWHQNTVYQAYDGRYVQFGVPYEHAALVVGVTDQDVLVYDPLHGPMWITKGSFETAYSVFLDMAVVLS